MTVWVSIGIAADMLPVAPAAYSWIVEPMTGAVPLRTWPWNATAVTVKLKVAVAVLPAESVTCTVTGMDVSPLVGMPVITPEGDKLSPTALRPVPDVTVHV
jgi:hypothetical protein